VGGGRTMKKNNEAKRNRVYESISFLVLGPIYVVSSLQYICLLQIKSVVVVHRGCADLVCTIYSICTIHLSLTIVFIYSKIE
jgi:hypothetical protein